MEKNKITHEGEIEINGTIIPCFILENGERVLSTTGMQKALGVIENEPNQRSSGRLDEILSSKVVTRLLSAESDASKYVPISCFQGNRKISAYPAIMLPEICEIMLKVRDFAKSEGLELGKRQQAVIIQSDAIIRGLARIGIIALIDEATGYQYERERGELQKILKAYISEELLPWQKRFPDEFYREIFRLNNWYFTVPEINKTARPGVIGKWTKKYIYSVLPKGVLQALLQKTPRSMVTGKLNRKLHQSLTREQGIEHLNKQIISTVTLMNISDNWDEFNRLWNKKFGQQTLTFDDYELLSPPIVVNSKFTKFDSSIKTALEHNPYDGKE